jgi:hypothetical protein
MNRSLTLLLDHNITGHVFDLATFDYNQERLRGVSLRLGKAQAIFFWPRL